MKHKAILLAAVLTACGPGGTYSGFDQQKSYIPVGSGFSDVERARLHRVMDTLTEGQFEYVASVTEGIHPSTQPGGWSGAYAWDKNIYFPHDWIYRSDGSIGKLEEDDRFGRIMIHEACHLHVDLQNPGNPSSSKAEEDYCNSVAGYCGPVGRDPCDTPNKVY